MTTQEELKAQIEIVLAMIETKSKQTRFADKANAKQIDSAAREIGAAAEVLKTLAYNLSRYQVAA